MFNEITEIPYKTLDQIDREKNPPPVINRYRDPPLARFKISGQFSPWVGFREPIVETIVMFDLDDPVVESSEVITNV